MKRVVFMIIATLLVVGLVLPGCAGGGGGDGGDGDDGGGVDTRPPITLAIAGPMTDFQGEHHWAGAELARDEINDGAGVNVGGIYHKIALIKVDTNEVSGTLDEGVAALEEVIDDVDFVVGGYHSGCVEVYREVAMDAQKIFMNCGAVHAFLQYSVVTDYDRYKYWFKGTGYNEWFWLNDLYKMPGIIGTILKNTLVSYGDTVKADYKVGEADKLRVVILAENAAWCVGVVAFATSQLPLAGYSLVGTWLVSPTATDISAELIEIEAKHPHVIFTIFQGPVGVTYSKQRVELGIPAMTIGYNVEGTQQSHWSNTEGKCNGEIMLDAWADGLYSTDKTKDFFNAFVAKTGEYPYYPATTYNAIYSLKEAIEAVSAARGWSDIADVVNLDNIDALIQYIETHPYTGTAGTTAYFPMPAITVGGGVYALSEAQVRTLYDLDTYG